MEPEARTVIAEFLARHDFDVIEASSGLEAIQRAREELPHLLIADGILPKMSGFQLCREIKALAEPKRIPVALVLEENDTYGRGRARVEGVDLILTDPVIPDDLADVLNIEPGDKDRDDKVLSGSSGTRDRFLKELLRGGPARGGDPVVGRISDPLTGLHHKAYMGMKLEEEFKKSQRYGNPLALLVVDVENFEEAIQTYGKAVAHELLLEVAGVFLCESRDVDAAGRVDEARFMLLLPSTDLQGARRMADRVFQQVCQRRVLSGGHEVAIRASVGIAGMPSDDIPSVEDFADRALRAMRTASKLGGNRICAWGDAVRA